MRTKYHCMLIAFLVMLAALFLGCQLKAQNPAKVKVKKQMNVQTKSSIDDSVAVIVKTITDNGTVKSENTDSLIHAFCPEHYGDNKKKVHIIHIENGDTLENKIMDEPFDRDWIQSFENDSIFQSFHLSENLGTMPGNSFNVWISRFDSLLDPLNQPGFEFNWVGNFEGLDSLIEKQLEFQIHGNNLDSMFFLSFDGEDLRIEKGGEMVFLNKKQDIEDIDSNIQITHDEQGRKVIVLETRIVLDELSEQEKEAFKSKGIVTSKQEPEFDYFKFYPNPADKAVNIEFRLAKKADCNVRVLNLLGQLVYEEKLNNFSGDYQSAIDLKSFGSGTYVIQIIQGKKSITRKIIVE